MSHMFSGIKFSETDAMIKSIDLLQPTGERSISTKFAGLYPNIEQALARNVTQRAIMEALKRNGLKLHPAMFKKLLEQARCRPSEGEEGIRCLVCGGVQAPSATQSQMEEGSEK